MVVGVVAKYKISSAAAIESGRPLHLSPGSAPPNCWHQTAGTLSGASAFAAASPSVQQTTAITVDVGPIRQGEAIAKAASSTADPHADA